MAEGGRYEHEDEKHAADEKERAAFELDELMADDEEAMRVYRERMAPPGRKHGPVDPQYAQSQEWPGGAESLDQMIQKFDEKMKKRWASIDPPSARQVAGNHYKDLAIQPSEYNHRNRLGWCEGNAVKYITRHRNKGGRKDIEKAIHYLELLIEWEYDNTTKENQND